MPDDPVTKCTSCGNDSYTDYPEGTAEARWPGSDWGESGVPLLTMCDECGASYPQSSIAVSVRKPVPDYHDGDADATMRRMQAERDHDATRLRQAEWQVKEAKRIAAEKAAAEQAEALAAQTAEEEGE